VLSLFLLGVLSACALDDVENRVILAHGGGRAFRSQPCVADHGSDLGHLNDVGCQRELREIKLLGSFSVDRPLVEGGPDERLS
jgi:hypothetical protein